MFSLIPTSIINDLKLGKFSNLEKKTSEAA